MSDILKEIVEAVEKSNEPIGKVHFPQRIVVESGALAAAIDFVEEAGFQRILVVADANTFQAVGKTLYDGLSAKKRAAGLTLVKPNLLGDVVADEASIMQLLLDIQRLSAAAIVAAGAGTLHDIARYAAFTCGIPFISVPTAPSVDGFTSKGAPLIIRGDKITVPAVGPIAIFADIDILKQAPPRMIAAGFGDMLGKYTSLFDWKFGALTAGEPYSPLVASITEQALESCVSHVQAIGRNTETGVAILTKALVESGLAMLIFGQSHPASGAEHHVSHYWEMEYIRTGRRQLLHGAKVGVACSLISGLYHRIADDGMEGFANVNGAEMRSLIRSIPDPALLQALLAEAGGPSNLEELGVEPELAERSLEHAHQVRPNRSTLLKSYNERRQRT